MKISIGNDHAGPKYKKAIVDHLEKKGHLIVNHGTNSEGKVDYPDLVHPVADDITKGTSKLGVIICGSGNGAAMTANKHQGIRAALCWNKELAKLARQHNDANIISLPSRFVSIEEAIEMVDIFINTNFDGGRHQSRIDKIPCS